MICVTSIKITLIMYNDEFDDRFGSERTRRDGWSGFWRVAKRWLNKKAGKTINNFIYPCQIRFEANSNF